MQTAYDRVLEQITENTALARTTRELVATQQARLGAAVGQSAVQSRARELKAAQQGLLGTALGGSAVQAQAREYLAAQQGLMGTALGGSAVQAQAREYLAAQQGLLGTALGGSAVQAQAREHLAAQQGLWAAAIGGSVTPEVVKSFAVDALEPLTRRVHDVSVQHAREIAQRVGAAQVRAYDRLDVSDLAENLDQDDAVDQLVQSPELRETVQDLVGSDPVRELFEYIDSDGLTEADAAEVLEHVTATLAPASYWPDRLTTAQVTVILSAIDVLVLAAVAAIYGYDVGLIADILAWPLAVLGVYGFAAVLGQKYNS